MKYKEAYGKMCQEFLLYDDNFKRFSSRLYNLQKKMKSRIFGAKEDAALIAEHRKYYPKNKKKWHSSEAERLLKVYVKNGLHKKFKPKELFQKSFNIKLLTLMFFMAIFTKKWVVISFVFMLKLLRKINFQLKTIKSI